MEIFSFSPEPNSDFVNGHTQRLVLPTKRRFESQLSLLLSGGAQKRRVDVKRK